MEMVRFVLTINHGLVEIELLAVASTVGYRVFAARLGPRVGPRLGPMLGPTWYQV